jgi:hypothetical protein
MAETVALATIPRFTQVFDEREVCMEVRTYLGILNQ